MAVIAVPGQVGIIDGVIAGLRQILILPAHLLVVVRRLVEVALPVTGTLLTIEQAFKIGYRAVVQVRGSDPYAVQGWCDIAVGSLDACRMISGCKPAFIE